MEKDYNNLIRKHAEYKKIREEKYVSESKDRLSKILKKKVETTMIGALSSIESHFGFLWQVEDGEETTPEKKVMYEIYQKVREEVLNKGNTQARNIDAELNQYNVNWLKYQNVIPVKEMKKEGNDE
tara:strand:- start:621 stop:998 length:378 start_codon:yes stop_codon:yes gene_type:complete